MYASWPCPLPQGGTGEEMVLGFDRQRERRILLLAPLFDEANKFRRQIVEIARLLDDRGVDAFVPDLPGCNESLDRHRHQTLAHWREVASLAAEHFTSTHVLAFRAGGWLAPAELPGWLLAPPQPRQILRNLMRAHAIALREAGKSEAADVLMEKARSEGITIGGWALGADLVRELEDEEFSASGNHRIVVQDELGGPGLWLSSENHFDAAQADALVDIVTSGRESS